MLLYMVLLNNNTFYPNLFLKLLYHSCIILQLTIFLKNGTIEMYIIEILSIS